MRPERAKLACKQRDEYRDQVLHLTAERNILKKRILELESQVRARERQMDVMADEMHQAGI